ncbi:hypothetical protein [Filimonas effusa]|uniref:Uncharacterized protein n=1 Tax=Filimonas effusa TaxID=2508721 RepID=A0A4Q1DBR3_9BACT|nr:hypothetical protein [Filimonas effusa]RXK86033.1 hypothetical protein ESB13_04280 [Filimonas effusa]
MLSNEITPANGSHRDNTLSTYRKFNDKALAAELIEMLKNKGIIYELEDSTQFFDPSYAYNEATMEIRIRLQQEDFDKADEMLAEYYKPILDSLEKDYHLYSFTDEELMDVVAKPDEWGIVDQLLAPRILKERGIELTQQVIGMLKRNRLKDLEKTEEAPRYLILIGYTSSLLGGLLGIIIGWHLSFFKKTLPDGTRHYAYRTSDRDHGTRMILLSAIVLISLTIWLYWGE